MTKLFQYTNLILLLLLNGCSGGTTGLKLTLGYDKDKQLLPQVNMDAKADNHWFENSSFFDGADVTERYKGTVTSSIAHYLDEGGVYFIDDKPSIQYLNSVVDKLLSGWDGPKVDYSILIKEDSEFDAVADEYGQIILTIGAFNKVSSDDELAALLAHEISHILLGHNFEKASTNIMTQKIRKSASIAQSALISKKHDSEGIVGDLAYTEAVNVLWGEVMSPAWSRDNENEADRLGLDLFLKAGYNQESFFNIVEMLQRHQINKSERLESLVNLVKVQSTLAIASKAKTGSGTKSNIKNILLAKGLESTYEGVDIVGDFLMQKNTDYETPEERGDSIKEYYFHFYPIYIGARAQNNITFQIQSNLRQYDLHAGIRSYYQIQETELFPTAAYIQAAHKHLTNGQTKRANDILLLGVERIGREYLFLPTLIRVAQEEKEIDLAEKYTIKCLGDKKNLFESALDTVMLKTSRTNNEDYYESCVKILGYDPVEKYKQKKAENTTEALNSPIKAVSGFIPSIDFFN